MIKVILGAGNFPKVNETLQRMGIANNKEKVIYQSCHLLFKNGEYFIVHFKEMFGLDGHEISISEEDIVRTESIALMLQSWDLLTVEDKLSIDSPVNNYRIISKRDTDTWTLKRKYKVGK